MTPAQEAAYALDFNVSRDDLKPEVQAEYDRLVEARQARPPASGSGMTVDAQGTVTIWQSGRVVLYADDHGVTVRRPLARPRRVAWAEISRFEDGGGYDSQNGNHVWKLVIVLRTGQRVEAYPLYGAPTPETVAAVRQLAERYGIPTDVAGVPMKDGQPVRRGLYHDPGGHAGLRYWDGGQWSPLLPPDIVRPRQITLPKSPGSWSALPTADGRWTYAASRATRCTVWLAACVAASAALLAGGLVVELWWDSSTHHRHTSGAWWFTLGGIAALWALSAWRNRRLFLKLDEATKGIPGSWA